jgi:hypothetical protein
MTSYLFKEKKGIITAKAVKIIENILIDLELF